MSMANSQAEKGPRLFSWDKSELESPDQITEERLIGC